MGATVEIESSAIQSTGFTLDFSLPFVKGFSILQSTGSTLDVSLPFVKGFSVIQSTGFTFDVSPPFVQGFSVLHSTGSTLDVSLPFVVEHYLKANIREEIANIPADTLLRVMANTRNRFIQ